MKYLITGGASGLGKSLAISIANQKKPNTKICIADIHSARANETVQHLMHLGVEAFYQPCDITEISDIQTLRVALSERWQGVDVIYNNAGVATGGSLESESIEQWQWILDINLLGMVRISQVFLDDFKQQGHGYFVNIASQAGLTPIPLMSSYNAVKAAVVGLSETMKLELSQYNVDVSVVCPSFFKTNLEESLRTTEPSVRKFMSKVFDRAELTSQQIADKVVTQVEQKRFLIITHKEGIKAFRLKRWLPNHLYIKILLKQTAGFLKNNSKKR